MAVAFDAVPSNAFVHGSEVTSVSLTTLTVGVGSNRALVVQVGLDRNHNAQTWSGVSMNWDSAGTPQACANITGANSTGTGGNSARVELWGLVAPTSGNKTLALSWTTNQEIFVCGVSWTGVNQTGGATSFTNAASAAGTGTTPAVSITSAVGDAVMSVMTCIAFIGVVGSTKTFNCNDAGGGDFCGSAGNRADGASSVSLTYEIDSAVWVVAGANIVASVAGRTTKNTRASNLGMEVGMGWRGGPL